MKANYQYNLNRIKNKSKIYETNLIQNPII